METAQYEQWDEKKLEEALMDVRNGMDVSTPWDTLKSNLAYGMVISRNEQADRKVAGFPQFGDIVLWRRQSGFNCKAIAKMTRGNSKGFDGRVCSADGTRVATLGDIEPVVLDWEKHIVGIVARWEEMASETQDAA